MSHKKFTNSLQITSSANSFYPPTPQSLHPLSFTTPAPPPFLPTSTATSPCFTNQQSNP